MVIQSKVFKNRKTGEYNILFILREISDWKQVKNPTKKERRIAEKNADRMRLVKVM